MSPIFFIFSLSRNLLFSSILRISLSLYITLFYQTKSKKKKETMGSSIKAILFDMDGTLLDTESLSDKAVLMAYGSSLPKQVFQESPMSHWILPWDLKKQILGLRGAEWAPIALKYAEDHWGVTEERLPPNP